ncbi:MAG: flagellar biosynthesis regulator FlaF [Pseudomonadota bacterium]
MNAYAPGKMALAAYGTQSAAVRTDRGTEYAAFMRITRRLKAAAEKGAKGFPDLVGALHDNRKLWTIIATEVADDGNKLPRQLRAQLIYLAEFTFDYSSKVLSRQADVGPLIEVNASVMRGLVGERGAA